MNIWMGRAQSRRTVVALISALSVVAALTCCAKREGALRQGAESGPKLVLTGAAAVPTIAVGQAATFNVTVANAGSRDASEVRVTDTVGKQSRLVSINCTASGGGVCPSQVGPQMVVHALPRGAALNFSVTARLIDGGTGTILNSMSASVPDATDPDQRSLTDPNESTVTNDVMVR